MQLRDCALSGSIITAAVCAVGILGSGANNKILYIFYIIGTIGSIIALIIVTVILIIDASVVSAVCSFAITECYQCNDPNTCKIVSIGKPCSYYANDYNSFCSVFLNRIWFVVADFFILSFFMFVTSILSCISLGRIETKENPRSQDQTIVIGQQPQVIMAPPMQYVQSPTGYMVQQQPMFVQQHPMVLQQQPMFVQQPMVLQQQPMVLQQQPMVQQQPVVQQQPMVQQQPVVVQQQSMFQQQPVVQQQPMVQQQPVVVQQQPPVQYVDQLPPQYESRPPLVEFDRDNRPYGNVPQDVFDE